MKEINRTPIPEGVHPEEIIRLIGYNLTDLRSASAKRRLADQRRVAAYVLRQFGLLEWHIGEVLNRKRVSVTAMLRTAYLVENEIKKAMKLIGNSDYGKETTQKL